MKRGNKDEILNMIQEIEKKKTELEEYLSKLLILSRNDTLKNIMKNIIKSNSILQEIEQYKGEHLRREVKEPTNALQNLVENYISKIQETPTKKIIYLREFLENFPSISNNDKDVIINSLKDEKNKDKLREKMSSLVNIFL
jgi:hypothetical protein